MDTNVRSSIQLFELCVKNKVKKVIFLSSGGTVYGDIDSSRITEDSVTKPKSPYGIGKLTIENYLRYFNVTHGLKYIVYRIANPYGPHQNIYARQGVIPIFIQHILDSLPLTVFGDGGMLRDYIYVEDVAKMICKSYALDNKHGEYNIGSGVGKSVNELIKLLSDTTGIEPNITYEDKPASYVNASVLDNGRFLREFGEFQMTNLDDGLRRTLEYVKNSKK
jgi:UDP-glucose 4-epimerase